MIIIDAFFYPSFYQQGMIPFILGQESTEIPPLLRRPSPHFLIVPRYPENKPLRVIEHEKIKRICSKNAATAGSIAKSREREKTEKGGIS